jgi:hypothetical protein
VVKDRFSMTCVKLKAGYLEHLRLLLSLKQNSVVSHVRSLALINPSSLSDLLLGGGLLER